MPSTLCVLLWAHPGAEAALAAYEDTVLRLVPDHGGRVVLRARNSGVLPATRASRGAEGSRPRSR